MTPVQSPSKCRVRIYREGQVVPSDRIPARLWRWPRGVCKASGAPATACTRLLTFRAAGFLYPFCLALLGWGMQNQTAPVAFTTARVPNGPLQKVFEQDGYRWTEGGNGTRHFWRSDCDIVPGRVAVHFTPQRALLLGPYPGVKADASCVLATCEEPLALEIWVADRAKPDFATADERPRRVAPAGPASTRRPRARTGRRAA